ncbi:MAG: hypothetical protein A2Y80_10450 [Deltaproteobacteria bacterium RBG_13_58_19]|nr:MAG: hypothetical protein A2Y80_10450 [Deltaproteobacteria bacterium RBG_13_58_19]
MLKSGQAFLQQRFRKDPDFVYRRIAQECLVVPIRHQVGDLNYIYVLNPVADRIWELLDGQNTVQEIRDRLLAEFKATAQEVEQDLREFLEQLVEIGGIKEA